jgi:transposase InsO family protein
LVNQILPAVPHLAAHLAPLTDLLKGRPRKTASIPWDSVSADAFSSVKDICLNPVHLASFDPNLETYLYTDWSTTGIGGWVGQKSPDSHPDELPRPVAFYSKKLGKSERNYAAYQGELLALKRCLDHFRQYLIGHPTILRFDQRALDGILKQKKLSPTQWRQLSTILEFDLRLEWIPGQKNTIADILSRLTGQQDSETQTTDALLNLIDIYLEGHVDHSPQLSANFLLNHHRLEVPDEVLARSKLAAEYSQLRAYLDGTSDSPPSAFVPSIHHFRIIDDALWYDSRLCISPSHGQELALHEHDGPSSIHPGVRRLVTKLGDLYYWPGMVSDITKIVHECINCQRNKTPNNPVPQPSFPHDAPESPWATVAMDFITGLPLSNNRDSVFTVTAVGCKRVRFIKARKDDTAERTARRYFKHIYPHHGLPTKFITDRDARWTSKFWTALCELLSISQNISTAFHPQTDGQAENRHRTLSLWFRCLTERHKLNWTEYLPLAEFTINAMPNSSIGMSPFEADIGRIPRRLPDDVIKTQHTPSLESFVQQQIETSKYLQRTLEALQEKNEIPQHIYRVGDLVMLKIRDFYTPHTTYKTNLRSPWIGPFKVAGKAGLTSYRLDLPASWQFHGTFHSSKLKPYIGEHPPETRPPPINVAGEPEYFVAEILMERQLRNKKQYLVNWLGYPLSEATWEPYSTVKETAAFKNYLLDRGLPDSGQ